MSAQVRASHILLMYKGSMRSSNNRDRSEAKQQIGDIATEIEGGADFADLARAHSDCPSGKAGGDLGSFGKGAMVPVFEQTAFALDVGATSSVIETPFGYHIIRRTA